MAAPAFHESLPSNRFANRHRHAVRVGASQGARARRARSASYAAGGHHQTSSAGAGLFGGDADGARARRVVDGPDAARHEPLRGAGPAAAGEGGRGRGRGAGARPRVHVGGVPARAAAEPGAAGEAWRAGVAPVELPPRGGAGAGRGRARPDKGRGGRGE
ncbi:hypothetical protein MGU_06945 [Metarhizium guizhouense ARSEF 977]|uniref:Uncharacterized protein n=1 Tax=Metarhizium guizhouense (strain ARSEF 977) TaxID=1276136 RepID=A0A0B4H7S5_METGA|nr:hypothetical protein MGU_06945 [Metarhizium guizhouense ARSEF 977]